MDRGGHAGLTGTDEFQYVAVPSSIKYISLPGSIYGMFKIITFYEFKDMLALGELAELRAKVRGTMKEFGIVGTIILAAEGYNATVAGEDGRMDEFVRRLERLLETQLKFKASFADSMPFRKVDVKLKPEIVTLKKPVDIALGAGTHVDANEWNELIASDDVFVLDTRNDYEYRTGTFAGAVNPKTDKFSELPEFVEGNLDPTKHKRVAMFCTGGIRCEKFAPYMRSLGFEEVYQLEGGILKYLETIPPEKQLWDGECFVFDGRRSVDHRLKKGSAPDYSQPTTKDKTE
jgi:UPF0176 protein